MTLGPVAIARIAHEVNRAYCAALGDHSQPVWEEAPEWQRDSAIEGVLGIRDGCVLGPFTSHANWLAEKRAAGWVYGPAKDPVAKTHPCMVPFDHLPPEHRLKDFLFYRTVRTLLDGE